MKKRNYLKTALAIAVIAALPSLVNAQQWNTNGNGGITGANYLGTQNNIPLRIATNAGLAYTDLADLRVIVMPDGSTGIGRGFAGVLPTQPRNKLLVENGSILNAAGDVYAVINNNFSPLIPGGLLETDMSLIAYSNNVDDGATNIGVVGLAQSENTNVTPTTGTLFGIGVVGLSRNAQVSLGGTFLGADGLRNVGVVASASVDPSITTLSGTNNIAVSASVDADNGADNLGIEVDVTGQVSANSNTGIEVDVDGDNAPNNKGIVVELTGNNATNNDGLDVLVSSNNVTGNNRGANLTVQGSAVNNKGEEILVTSTASGNNIGSDINVNGIGNLNLGSEVRVSGGTSGTLGVSTIVSGGATYNTGFRCQITGNSTTNLVSGVDVDADATNLASSVGVDANALGGFANNVGGHFKAKDGTWTIGVIGEINGPCVTPGSDYAVYGTNPNNCTNSWAGYFNGNVFASAYYMPSDQQLKENVREFKGALEQLQKLDIKNYTYKSKDYPGMSLPQGEQVGLMAANLEAVFPNMVKKAVYPGSLSGYKDVEFSSVNTTALVPVLVQAVKELDARSTDASDAKKEIEALKADKLAVAKELEAVKADNETLKKDMADVKDMLDKICSNGCGDFKPASTLGGTTGSESGLFQNIPNPFSNNTVIPYTIGQGVKQAVLIVTNVNGAELRRFTTSQIGAGTFEVNMDEFGAGTYVYSLFTDGKLIDTKKMALAGK